MFDIGWSEMVVVATVAILVVGPKDLPGMLRAFGKTMGNLRRMASDFQRQFNDALKESDLDELQNIASPSTFAPLDDAKKSMEEFQKSVTESMQEKQAKKATAVEEKPAVKTPAKPKAKAPAKAKATKPKPRQTAKAPATRKRKPAKSKS